MEPADSIRRLGFARWYERRLIEGHAWFISVVSALSRSQLHAEELNFRGSVGALLRLRLTSAGGSLGQRSESTACCLPEILIEAEQLGEHATCGACAPSAPSG